jgi:outer membrane protein OmpA-like peptidoglycan-associated protein
MRLPVAALALAVLAGCAETPPRKAPAAPEMVAVVPGPTGHVGAVVVRSEGGEQVLDRAFVARRVKADGTVETTALTPEAVHEIFADTVKALPGRPTSFTLYFLEGKDELTPGSRAELDKVFGELRRRPAPDIQVIGHTDTVGNLAFNDKLSLARAERVRDMLVGLGIEGSRIQSAGRGKRELLVPTDDNVAEPRNRRVEINVR